MNLEDFMLGLEVWNWELDFSIYSTRPNESGVKSINFVSCHDNLHLSMSIETIKLIE